MKVKETIITTIATKNKKENIKKEKEEATSEFLHKDNSTMASTAS